MPAAAPGAKPAVFNFHLSCDINLPVQLRVLGLQGVLPWSRQRRNAGAAPGSEAQQPPADHNGDGQLATDDDLALEADTGRALYLQACLTSAGEELGLGTRTTYAEASSSGARWDQWLSFCIKVRPQAACSGASTRPLRMAPVAPGDASRCACHVCVARPMRHPAMHQRAAAYMHSAVGPAG